MNIFTLRTNKKALRLLKYPIHYSFYLVAKVVFMLYSSFSPIYIYVFNQYAPH
jgi:hypothetical protein